MFRQLLLAGAVALASTTLAQAQPSPSAGDPSNPAAAPLSPSQDSVNQPARGQDSEIVRDADILSGTATQDMETEADRQAREEAARPKPSRTMRMGERTVSTPQMRN